MTTFLRRPSTPKHLDEPGVWFVTIVVWGALPVLGQVVDGDRLVLGMLGRIVHRCWVAIPEHFLRARLHRFVVMPNHLHGIIELAPGTRSATAEGFGKPVPGSIATIVRSFKVVTTREVRKYLNRPVALWQGGYHAHPIACREEMDRAGLYIERNPARWKEHSTNVSTAWLPSTTSSRPDAAQCPAPR